MIGQTIDGKYEILREIGEGGMGAVYEARHAVTGRRVALKVILREKFQGQSGLVERFRREARAAGQIETPHIVQVLDSGVDEATGAPFMVMELLRGEDLDELLKRVGNLAPEVAARIAIQACMGLQKAHDAGVIHRDIKPANLFLSQDDEGNVVVKLLDFGIAKIDHEQLADTQSHGLTQTGHLLGSPRYMSPEQAMGQKSLDARTDLWSIGVVLYQMLTGRAPHDDADTVGKLILAICSKPSPPVQSYAPWVSPELATVVHHALVNDVAGRYGSALEIVVALKPLSGGDTKLDRSMLVQLPEELLGLVAPRMQGATGDATILEGSDTLKDLSSSGLVGESVMGRTPAGNRVPIDAFARTAIDASISASKPSFLPKAAIGVAVLIGAAIAVWRVNSSRSASAPPVELSAATPAMSAPVLKPPSTTAATTKKVRVAIPNAGAAVEIDGQAKPVIDGFVELEGALGSVHPVKLSASGKSTTADVIVTESGARPDKIELTMPAAARPNVDPKRAGNSPGTPAETPKVPPVRSKAGGLDKTFE